MRKHIFTGLLLTAVSLSISSCFSQRYKVGPLELTEKTIINTQKSHFLFYGLVALNEVMLDSLTLDSANYRVEVIHTFPDVLVSAMTVGVYTPSTIRVEVSAEKPIPKRKRILLLKFPDPKVEKE
ncbi:MAG: hypothetical protein DA405_11875 [Bacteroidetes bacterium]|nr:MAG: hypothetical protein DA405_11875 [Bacteroidota bacterium]